MNPAIETELEILWSGDDNVEANIEALKRLISVTTKDDVPALVEALKSERSDFWIRELLSEPICQLGGSQYLADLFEAFARNYADGHDNDGFAHCLTEMAELEPETCRAKLEDLLHEPDFAHQDHARWLLEFCK